MSIIPLDFESVAPLIKMKPTSVFTLKGKTFNDILKQFKVNKKSHLLIFMRAPITAKQATDMGWKISKKMSKDSLVVWAAEEHSKYEFEFYVYEPTNTKLEMRNIKEYYTLTSKILKLGFLTDKESAHLATMFADASTLCNPESNEIDSLYNKALDLSINHSNKSKNKKK